MIKILLDFPWEIDELLNRHSPAVEIVADYFRFQSIVRLGPVRFISQPEAASFFEKIGSSPHHWIGNWIAPVIRFVNQQTAIHDAGEYRAIPTAGPADLRDIWMKALRDEMADLENWRTPQIGVYGKRKSIWEKFVHDHEIKIALEDKADADPQKRVVIFINSHKIDECHRHKEEYEAHKYALADIDPWDVRHCNAPGPDGLPNFKCRLPRPTSLDGVNVDGLDERLPALRSQSWPSEGKYWFVPPASWTWGKNKTQWRKGSFDEKTAENNRKGPIDYKGQIWAWHSEEGHWDVQLKNGKRKQVKSNGDSWD